MRCTVFILAAVSLCSPSVGAKKFNLTVGYLPCILGNLRNRQGLTISGALSLALEEINNSQDLLPDVDLLLDWYRLNCDNMSTLRVFTDMVCRGVVAFFGPEHRCYTEAMIAQARNLPMISYKCSDTEASQLSNFIRIDPLETKAMKSVISLLKYYRWNKFSIVYEESWESAAKALADHASRNNMTVNHESSFVDAFTCCQMQLPCCAPRFWYQFIQHTKSGTRIYVFLGSRSSLLEMMTAMEVQQLFAEGEYMVIFVDMMAYSPREGLHYLIKLEDIYETKCQSMEEIEKRGKSLLVVATSEPPSSLEQFNNKVRRYNTLEPFRFPDVFGNKHISIYAAYLYDSVKLYAKALDELIKEDTGTEPLTYNKLMSLATNGSRIIKKVIDKSPFVSISGKTTHLDENGDAEGEFSMLAFKKELRDGALCSNMVPVAHFQNSGEYPEYRIHHNSFIDWPGIMKPGDEPSCGFSNEKCSQ